MTKVTLHPLAEDYLKRLRHAGRGLPRERREDLVAQIEAHLAEAIAPGASDAEARAVLVRLGSPEEIVDAEQPAAAAHTDRRTWREWTAVVLLALGGFVVGMGWLVGLVLLWTSRLWTTRDKLIGTLIVPGGIATTLIVVFLVATKRRCTQYTRIGAAHGAPLTGLTHCTSTGAASAATTAWHIALIAFLILAPLASAVYLARRAGHTPNPA